MPLDSILSAEPLPRLPVIEGEEPELDAWRRNVHNYLRRLMGRFTDAAIEDAAGAMVIWEHFSGTTSTVTATPGDSGWKTLKSAIIPANTIGTDKAVMITAWGQNTTTVISTDFHLRFRLGGDVLVETLANFGTQLEFWRLWGAIQQGLQAWMLITEPSNKNTEPVNGSTSTDLTIDQTFDLQVNMPNAITSFDLDFLHLRQVQTHIPD